MRIIQTKGTVKGGKLKAEIPSEVRDGEVDIIVLSQEELDDFESMRQIGRTQGYDSREKILDLIYKVKLEILEEKGSARGCQG